MRIALVFLVTGICVGFLGEFSFALPVAHHHVLEKDFGRSVDEMFDSYVSISHDRADNMNELDVLSQIQRIYVDAPKAALEDSHQKSKTAYLLVKTLRQRNKRYISYLTLCHFKICNMGRKRTTRYFHMIRRHDDNES